MAANHAAIIKTGSRGANAWNDAASEYDWVEYGNPHSTMGQGDFIDFKAEFIVAGKIMNGKLFQKSIPVASSQSNRESGVSYHIFHHLC